MDLTLDDVVKIFAGIYCLLASAAQSLLVILVVIAGFRLMLAGGNPEKYNEAKKNITWVLIGTVVIFGTGVIIATVSLAAGHLGGDPYFGFPYTCGF